MKYLSAFLFALIFFSSCQSYHIYADKAKDIDFANYKTYAWLPDVDTGHGKLLMDNEILRQNIHKAVNAELPRHGLTLDNLHPQTLIIVHTRFEKREEIVRTPLYSSYPYYYTGVYIGPWYPYYWGGYNTISSINGYDIQQVDFTQGSIVVDIIDSKTRKLLWRGWTEEDFYKPADFDQTVNGKVRGIFRKYPVKAKSDTY